MNVPAGSGVQGQHAVVTGGGRGIGAAIVSAADARAPLAKRSPRVTLITPQEVAQAVLWLCSPEPTAITGQAIADAAGEVM
jgi:NAD(P)-dependent dehydrogenase (short-subunit alcohol dehydrogenase family)